MSTEQVGAEPVAYEVRRRDTGNLIRVSVPTDFWPTREEWSEKYQCDLIPLYRHPAPAYKPNRADGLRRRKATVVKGNQA